MLNFVYAFDKNYYIQACVSIYSLLEKVSKPINLYLILDSSSKNLDFPSKIIYHKNLNCLTIKNFNNEKSYYNLNQAHVSNATFYRLYLSDLFLEEDFELVYLDSDIICVNDPCSLIELSFEEMKNDKYFIGFADEVYKEISDEPFIRLNMVSNKYFNAGVMLLNLEKWKINNLTNRSLDLINNLKEKAKFWDQDILNSLIDGNYYSINNNLNFRSQEGINDDIIFLHYSGKSKPWDVGGIFEIKAYDYHKFYQKLFEKQFHIVVKNRKNSVFKLFKTFKNASDINLIKYFQYLFFVFIKIIKK